jgi:DNA-binding LytR/AlgR family response regulator
MKKNAVFIWQDRVLKKIYPDTIHCLTMDRNYTNIFVTEEDYVMVRCSLDNALKVLPEDEFVKIHRSHAVPINYIEEVGRDYVLISGKQIPLSKQYYKALMKKLPIIGRQSSLAKD